jgi:hypothetical protein
MLGSADHAPKFTALEIELFPDANSAPGNPPTPSALRNIQSTEDVPGGRRYASHASEARGVDRRCAGKRELLCSKLNRVAETLPSAIPVMAMLSKTTPAEAAVGDTAAVTAKQEGKISRSFKPQFKSVKSTRAYGPFCNLTRVNCKQSCHFPSAHGFAMHLMPLRSLVPPDRVLPGNGEVRAVVPHLDEAQIN